MDKEQYFRVIGYVLFVVCILLLPVGFKSTMNVRAQKYDGKITSEPRKIEKKEKINGLPPKEIEKSSRYLRWTLGYPVTPEEEKKFRLEEMKRSYREAENSYNRGDLEKALRSYANAQENRQALIRLIRKGNEGLLLYPLPLLPGSSLKIDEISRTLLQRAHSDYEGKAWSKCDEKLSAILVAIGSAPDSSITYNTYGPAAQVHILRPTNDIHTTLEGRTREEAKQLKESNLLAWGMDSYQKARVNGSWADARLPYENMRKSEYVSEVKKVVASEWLRRIENLDAAYKMPGGMVVDVLAFKNKRGVIHIASKSTDLTMEAESVEWLTRDKGFQKELKDAQRLLVTPNVESEMGPLDFAELFPNKVVWRATRLEEAAKTIDALSKQRFSVNDSTTVLLLPRNERQKELLGLNWGEDTRERVWEAAEGFLDENPGIDVVNRGGLLEQALEKVTKTTVYEKLIKALQEKKNVLIFFAHGGRNFLRTPDGKILTSEEVSRLDLHSNRPNVFLFSCESGKPGDKSDPSDSLEKAFKKAGANTVWAIEKKVEARDAISVASELLNQMKSGISMLDAIEAIAPKSKYGVRLRARRETDTGQDLRFTLEPTWKKFAYYCRHLLGAV